jgi:uncharacterized protein YndB with AHSA1/START domain
MRGGERAAKEAGVIYVWILLGLIVTLVVLVGAFVLVMGVIGKGIPEEHEATSVIEIHAPAADVFDAIAAVEQYSDWSRDVTQVFVLPEHNGMQTVRMRQGRNSFVLTRTRFEPPTLLERTISDDHASFSGTWLYRVKDVAAKRGGGEPITEVSLKENGKVKWPAARAMMKHMFGYHAYTHRHLQSLAAKFEPNPGKAHRA